VAKTKNTTDCLIAGTARAIARPKKQICKDEFTLYWVQILISLLVIAIFAGAAALWDDDDLPWRKPRSQPKKWLSAQITLGQRIARVERVGGDAGVHRRRERGAATRVAVPPATAALFSSPVRF
jgi:hypothetical protein